MTPALTLGMGAAAGLLAGAALSALLLARARRRLAALRAEAAACAALVEDAPDAAFVHDAGGAGLRLNRAARALLGLGEGAAPPSLLDVVDVADRASARRHLAALAASGYARTDLRLAGFEPRLVDVASRLTGDGRALSLARDVSAKRAEVARLTEALAHAEEAARVRSTFLAQMSHEIRTPLTSVIGFAELLHDEVGEAQRGLVEAIGAGGQRLLATLDSVLDLATLDARRETLRPVATDVVAEVEAAVARVRGAAEEKGLALAVEPCRDTLPATLDADALGRILAHILSNAVRYTEAGRVTVEVDADAESVSLRVLDTGIGIPQEALAGLFAGFGESDTGGFGLAIADRLVTLMGGSISVESQWRAGTAVTVTLPRGRAEPEPAALAG